MSELNPYDSFLDGRPIQSILAATSSQIRTLINTMGPEKTSVSPAPGKWSAAQVVCHLADCELAFGFRLRQTLAEDNHVIQPFDQEKWAAGYSRIPAQQALDAFSAMREWNLTLLDEALPGAAAKTVAHPERGAMTVQTIVETMAGHDLNHLAQLKKLAL